MLKFITMTRLNYLIVLLICLRGVSFPQGVSDFNSLYKFYSRNYFQRIEKFHIKDFYFGFIGNADSNFFMHPDIVEADNSLALSLSFRGAYLYKKRLLMEVLSFFSYANHFDHSDYNFLNRGLTANLYVKLGHSLLWKNSYSTSRNRLRLYDIFGQLAIFDVQGFQTHLSYETTRHTILSLAAKLAEIKVSGDLFSDENSLDDRYNQNKFSLEAGLAYRLTPKTTASFVAGVYKTDFPNYPRQSHGGFQAQVGVRFPQLTTEEGRISGRVLFGVKTYDLDQYNKHFSTWTADTDLVVSRGRLRCHFQVSRDFDFAIFQVSPLVRTSSFAGMEYYLSKRIFLGVGFRYHHLDYRVPLIIGWKRTFVTADSRTPMFSFGVRTLHGYWLTLTWSRSNWTSDNYFYYNKQRNVVSFSFVKRF